MRNIITDKTLLKHAVGVSVAVWNSGVFLLPFNAVGGETKKLASAFVSDSNDKQQYGENDGANDGYYDDNVA